MSSQLIYGCLLGLQITCAIIIFFNIYIAFMMLLFVAFAKGLLYQYEYFYNEELIKQMKRLRRNKDGRRN